MKIMVIIPNTSQQMTEHLEKELTKIKRADTELTVICPEHGPITIESAYDEALAAVPTLELVKKAGEEGYDGVIIACFSDPALHPAKEISDILVVGIQEVTIHVAAMIGAKYTIITPMKKRIPHKEKEIARYKQGAYLASVRSLEMTVAETEEDPVKTKQRILEVATLAVEEDGAEVIILGCAGMVGYAEDIEKELSCIVLDPSSVALKICEGMVDCGLKLSKRAFFAYPPEKIIK